VDKEQERVFQPYYQIKREKEQQADGVTEGKRHMGSGMGLGLAIARFLVELHGGKIWLESTLGRGSSFFFSLPVAVSIESHSS
jgi:two-component system phosphate regulon sensor histidine kinase PhoR